MRRCGSGLHRLTRDDTGGQPCTAAEVILSRPRIQDSMAKPTTITTVAGLCEIVEQEFQDDKSTTVLYRGHGAKSFSLQPRVGRGLKPNENSSGGQINQKLMLELFRRQSIDRLAVPTVSNWELLAVSTPRNGNLSSRLDSESFSRTIFLRLERGRETAEGWRADR